MKRKGDLGYPGEAANRHKNQALSYCADEARRGDPDRFLTALFAPREARESVFAILAFSLELARVAESVSRPALGDIRLQWWREALDGIYDGTPKAHPVIDALATAVRDHGLPRPVFDAMIDARGADLDEELPESLDALRTYASQTSGAVAILVAHTLVANRELPSLAREVCEQVGTAWALTGLVRAIPFHAARGRVFIPRDLLGREGIGERDVIEGRRSRGLLRAIGAVVEDAKALLKSARAHHGAATRQILPALLPAALADLYLRILERPDYDPFRTDTRIPTSRLQLRLMHKAAVKRY